MSDIESKNSFNHPFAVRNGADTLWSFNGTQAFPGPGHTAILYRRLNDQRLIAQPGLLPALQQCQQFRPLKTHAKNIIAAMPSLAENHEDVINTLTAVRDAGLLESSEQAWKRLTDPAASRVDVGCRIFILTCDRPEALSRLLSALVHQPLPPQIEGICVIDDSRDPAILEQNARLIDTAQSGTRLPISHFDLVAREQLIGSLLESVPEHIDEIQFLLDRQQWGDAPTYGLARNLALLLSAGKHALVIDDDVMLEAIAPPLSPTNLSVGTANQRQAVFYQDSEELNQHAMVLPDSPISLMLQHLGQPVGHAFTSALRGHNALGGWDGELLQSLTSGSRIMLTQCGSWGDPGTGSGEWAFFLDEPSTQRMLNMGPDPQHALSTRACWFGYRGPLISQYGTLSQLTGLANTHVLPPYLPAGRGEDILFGILLQRMYPDSAVMNEGWAIRHEPLENRNHRGKLQPLSPSAGLSSLGDWLGRAPADQWGQSPEKRLKAVAEQIMRLSTMEDAALRDLARTELVSKSSSLLTRCFAQLEAAERMASTPGYDRWVQFLQSTRDQLVKQIQSANASPMDGVAQLAGGMHTLQKGGQRFAAALFAWPRIVAAAKTMQL